MTRLTYTGYFAVLGDAESKYLFALERGPIRVRFLETFVRSGMPPRNDSANEF